MFVNLGKILKILFGEDLEFILFLVSVHASGGRKKRAVRTHVPTAPTKFALKKDLSFYTIVFVRYSQLLASFCATRCQYSATVCGCHSFTEPVFVSSLSVRGLECSFHLSIYYYVIIP